MSERFRTWVRTARPEWGSENFHVAGAGLEMCVLRVKSPEGQVLAVRVPWEARSYNANDGVVEGGDLLRKEAVLTEHLSRYGFPVARPLHLILEPEFEGLVTEYVEDDGKGVEGDRLGAVVRRLHEIPSPFGPDERLVSALTSRIKRRLAAVERLSGRSFFVPDREELQRILEPVEDGGTILHLDLRASNVLAGRGQILALIDWTNSLVAHPAIEMARLAEYGGPLEAFLQGYGRNPLLCVPEATAILLRLDTAVMLALVFLSEAPDPVRAHEQVDRVGDLSQALRKVVR